MYIFVGIVLVGLIFCCVKHFKLTKNFAFLMYGFLDLETIKNNLEILKKELDFINQGINGLSKIALTATGMIMSNIFIFRDEILCKFGLIEVWLYSFVLILFSYVLLYCIEVFYKTEYKKEIIEKINNLSKDTKK